MPGVKLYILTLLFCFSYGIPSRAQYLGGNSDGSVVSQLNKTILTDGIYLGGSNDGFTVTGLLRVNLSDTIYKGAANDGFSQTYLLRITLSDTIYKGSNSDGISRGDFSKINLSDTVYKGGIGDGIIFGKPPVISISDTIYKGGNNDGFVQTLLPKAGLTDTIYKGGTNDGYIVYTLSKTDITDATVYFGGAGRGETQTFLQNNTCGTPGISSVWNGSVSNEWHNVNNWNCGNIPTLTSTVIIPSGLGRYPTVFANVEVKSLSLQPGSSVTVLTGILLKLNGP